jgi:hypothetical protein
MRREIKRQTAAFKWRLPSPAALPLADFAGQWHTADFAWPVAHDLEIDWHTVSRSTIVSRRRSVPRGGAPPILPAAGGDRTTAPWR